MECFLLLLISESQLTFIITTIKTIKTMKEIKIIFITAEIAMIIGLVSFVFLPDWVEAEQNGEAILYKIMIVLLALSAMCFQHEQEQIEWDDEEEQLDY